MKIKNILSSLTGGMLATCAKAIGNACTESMESEKKALDGEIDKLEEAVNADRCNKMLQTLVETEIPEINKMLTVLKTRGMQSATDAKAQSLAHFISLKRPRKMNWGEFRTFMTGLVAMPAPSDRLASLLHSKLSQKFEALENKVASMIDEAKGLRNMGTCAAPRKAIVENIWTAYNLALLGTGDDDAAVANLILTIETVCAKAKQTLTHGGSSEEEKEETNENVSGDETDENGGEEGGDENSGNTSEGVLGGNSGANGGVTNSGDTTGGENGGSTNGSETEGDERGGEQ